MRKSNRLSASLGSIDPGAWATAAFETFEGGFRAVIADIGASAPSCGLAAAALERFAAERGIKLAWRWREADLMVEASAMRLLPPLARAALAQDAIDTVCEAVGKGGRSC